MLSILTPAMLRLAGVVALFVAWGSYLTARGGQLTAHEAGAVVTGFALALITLHVVLVRRSSGPPPPDANLAALLGALPLVPGLALLFWQRPGAGATEFLFYGISNHVLAAALLIAAAVALVAFLLGRQPRWLIVAPLALVTGLEVWPSSGGELTAGSQPGGGWGRFAISLLAIAAVLVAAKRGSAMVERNLLIAAVLLASLAFVVAPAGGRNAVRDLLGLALLTGIAVVVRRRITVGIGLGIFLLCLLELRSLAASGHSLAPAAVLALAGAGLFGCSVAAERSGRHFSA